MRRRWIRVKAVATSVMYDMSRAMGHGVGDGKDRYSTADRRAVLQYLNEQRWKMLKAELSPAVVTILMWIRMAA